MEGILHKHIEKYNFYLNYVKVLLRLEYQNDTLEKFEKSANVNPNNLDTYRHKHSAMHKLGEIQELQNDMINLL